MPKKRKDRKPDRPDKFQWTCRKCAPPTVIKGHTKRDVEEGRVLHMALVHN